MYIDFEDDRPQMPRLGGALTPREGLFLSIIFHLCLLLAIVLMPEFPSHPELIAAQLAREEELARERERNAQRFVFVAPRREIEALKPPARPDPDLSDRDRRAQAPERAPNPSNLLPFSRGNSPELADQPGPPQVQPPADAEPPRGPEGPARQDQPPGADAANSQPPGGAVAVPGRGIPVTPRPGTGGRGSLSGSIADALRNIQRYAGGEVLENQQGGGGMFGPSIQFDTKGVEFGPWIRRFIAQIKRNWLIPLAAMAMKGHVVLTFNVHTDGRITDLAVAAPCDVEAFNNAAFNAMAMSNLTHPLPPEYPADRVFFTVTFYYNESPPYR